MADDAPRMPTALHFSQAATLFSALANEARLRALVALARGGELTVGELLPLCGLEPTALSHHLRILRHEHLVTGTRRGKEVVYSLADEHIAALLDVGLEHAAERAPRRKKSGAGRIRSAS